MTDPNVRATPIMSNWLYDRLKYLTMIVLPALGALYFGLAAIWGLPAGEQVVGSITVVVTFFGVVLRISTTSYNQSDARFDGSILQDVAPDGIKTFQLAIDGDPEEVISNQDEITFKIL